MIDCPPELLQVRNGIVCFYVLRHGEVLYLIDTGFLGGLSALHRALRRRGWERLPIRGILLTHGHLDHTFNVSAIAAATGAWVSVPQEDRALLEGRFDGATNWGRFGDGMQVLASRALGYRALHKWRSPGGAEISELLGGLSCLPLPGHTAGHRGFLWENQGLLFSGDLFASFGDGGRRHRPPSCFNLDSEAAKRSLSDVAAMSLRGVLPNHADQASPAEHWRRLKELAD